MLHVKCNMQYVIVNWNLSLVTAATVLGNMQPDGQSSTVLKHLLTIYKASNFTTDCLQ